MSRKVTQEEFVKRVKQYYPDAEFEVLKYHSLKKPTTIRCLYCETIHERSRAEFFIKNWPCCGKNEESSYEKIVRLCKENGHFEVVKKVDSLHLIMRHLDCGNEFKKTIQAAIAAPCACQFCQTQGKKLRISKEDAQKQLDEIFNGEIELLSFDGVDSKNSKFRCLKCGLIFSRSYYVQVHGCRGCPKCDQRKSKGERNMRNWLEERKIIYKEQIRFSELPRLAFDFGVYDDKGNLKYLIEVQGEQHFKEVFHYPSRPNYFKTQQEHDEQKRAFCKEKGIPLYEILNSSGKLTNLEILPNSTTISCGESKIET